MKTCHKALDFGKSESVLVPVVKAAQRLGALTSITVELRMVPTMDTYNWRGWRNRVRVTLAAQHKLVHEFWSDDPLEVVALLDVCAPAGWAGAPARLEGPWLWTNTSVHLHGHLHATNGLLCMAWAARGHEPGLTVHGVCRLYNISGIAYEYGLELDQ